MLCDKCGAFFAEPKFSRHGYLSSMLRRPEDFQPHHESYESLQKSLTAECQLCRRLWANFAMPSRTAIGKKIHTSDGFRPDVDLSTFSMRCRLAVETKNHAVVSITCLIHAERGGKIQSQKSEEFMFMAPGKHACTPLVSRISDYTRPSSSGKVRQAFCGHWNTFVGNRCHQDMDAKLPEPPLCLPSPEGKYL
jgi:hypothetical protein